MFKNIHLWIANKLFFYDHRGDIKTLVRDKIDVELDSINNIFNYCDSRDRIQFVNEYFREYKKQFKERIKGMTGEL